MSSQKPNLDSLFLTASEIKSDAERAAFLADACRDDDDLRQQVEQLLRSDQQAGSFLEKPASGLDPTILPDSSKDRAAALDAGLATAFEPNTAVVLGDANHSVLKRLGITLGAVPQVSLRESAAEGDDPIARPKSPEMPTGGSDSRYQLQGEIARGGMGAILKGRDTDLGRDLAIKVLLDSHKDKPEVIQRFVEEAQIGGQLQHPGIAPIYELGQFADKRPFFAMKLVKGETLAKLLADREDAADERGKFIGIFEQVCQTMAYAHSRGVIHRDLKPANIMVGAFGEVQVMDWGLAKVLQVGGVADEKKSIQKHSGQSVIATLRSGVGSDSPGTFGTLGSQTQMGSVMGTPAYMPPEQALGEIDQMDERADVFGLGAILCEILTGKPPYVADDGTRVFRMASRGKLEDAFARLDACGADAELIALTKHCLEMEPKDRPRNASVLAEHVTDYLESVETKLRETEMERAAQAARADAESLQAEAERQRAQAESRRAEAEGQRAELEQHTARRLRRFSAAIGLVALFAIGASITAGNFWRDADVARLAALESEQAARVSAAEAQREAERATAQQQIASAARDEADIRAYTATLAAAVADLQRNDSRTLRRRLEETPEHLRGWEWTYLWNESDRSLETTLQLPPANPGYRMNLSPDGRLVAVRLFGGNEEPITVYDTRTGAETAVLKTYSSSHPEMTFSADNKWLAYDHHGRPGVQIFEIASGRALVPDPHAFWAFLGFDPAGKRAVMYDSQHKVRIYRTADWSVEAELPSIGLANENDYDRRGAVSPDGKLLAVSGLETDPLRIFDLSSRKLLTQIPVTNTTKVLQFSDNSDSLTTVKSTGVLVQYAAPEWKQVAETVEERQSRHALAVHRLDDQLLQLTFDSNGAVVLYNAKLRRRATLGGHGAIGLAIAVDSEQQQIVSAHYDGTVRRWDLWHPQNRLLAVESHLLSVAFSPDGTAVCVGLQADIANPTQLCEVDASATGARVSGFLRAFPVTRQHDSSADDIAYSPEGRRVAVATSSGWGHGRCRVYDSWTGLTEHEFSGPDMDSVDWSADGKWIAVGGHYYLDPSKGFVGLYDASSFQPVATLTGAMRGVGGVHAVAFGHDGQQLATATEDGMLRIFEIPSGKLLNTLGKSGDSAVNCVTWSPDDSCLLAGSADGTVAAWNPFNGENIFHSRLHGAAVTCLAYTPDGTRVMTAGLDRSLKIIDPSAWRELLTLHLKGSASGMSFSPDGQRLALADGSLTWLESEPETDRASHRKWIREAKERATSLVQEVLEKTTDPLEARQQITNLTASDDSLQQGALRQLRIELDDHWRTAYSTEAMGGLVKLHLLRQQLSLTTDQMITSPQASEMLSSIRAATDRNAMQRQALAEYAVAYMRLQRINTELFARDLLSASDTSPDQYLTAYFGIEPRLRQKSDDAFFLKAMALAEYRVGLYADAIDTAQQGIAIKSTDKDALAQLFSVLVMSLRRTGAHEAANKMLPRLRESLKGIHYSTTAAVVQELAKEAKNLAPPPWDEEAAWKSCQTRLEQLQLDPPKLLHWQARSLERMAHRSFERGEHEQAKVLRDRVRTLYETRLAAAPDDSEAALGLADLLLLLDSNEAWTVLEPKEMKATGGTTLTLQEDGSILAGGTNPPNDIYTLSLDPKTTTVRAIRLETLPDDRMPNGGSGRDPRNGVNFALTGVELRLESGQPEGTRESIPLQSVHVDFSDPNSGGATDGAAALLDSSDATYWSAYPVQTRRHVAIFESSSPIEASASDRLIVELRFQHPSWKQQGLGRFRLSVSEDAAVMQRIAAMKLTDPWAKLATAYRLRGDQAAFDKLCDHNLTAAVSIGELYATNRNWEQAIAVYNRALTHDKENATLLTKRATAYEKLQQWELAFADWTQASKRQHDVAFQRFKPADAASWTIQAKKETHGQIAFAEGALELKATSVTGSDEHPLAIQSDLQFENGADYAIRFQIKSPDACPVTLRAGSHESADHLIGLNETFTPATEFQQYDATFTAHDVHPDNNRLEFVFGTKVGTISIKEFVIVRKSEGTAFDIARGTEYARQGQRDEALAAFTHATKHWTERDHKTQAIAALAPLDGALESFAKPLADDGQFLAELARHYEAHDNAALAKAARTKAIACLEQQLLKEPDNAAFASELAAVLDNTHWTVLKPSEMKSEGGATLTLLDDGSILASGKNPDQDAYEITVDVPVQRITAIRLEVIPDASLPHRGPGRYSANGNLHLNEFRVLINGTPHQPEAVGVTFADPFAREQYRQIIDGTIDKNSWSIFPRSGERHTAVFATDLELTADDALTLELVSSRGNAPQHNLGRFRLWISADAEAFNEQKRIVAKIADPWARLAGAYYINGDQTAADSLLEHHPLAAADIADLCASDEDWERAITLYGQAITAETTDVILLSKRAAAYVATEQWELANVDWTRIVEQHPERLSEAFNVFRHAEQWKPAADFGRLLLQHQPDLKSRQWIAYPTIFVLSGDRQAYVEACEQMRQAFADGENPVDEHQIVKACLLWPNAIDLDTIPTKLFTQSLDNGTTNAAYTGWHWGTRALLAYRSGDADSAVKYVAKSEEHKPHEFAHAMNLVVLALAQHELGHPDEAAAVLADASQLIARLNEDPNKKGDLNLLIAEILFREAEAKITDKPESEPPGAASAATAPDDETPPAGKPDAAAGND